MKTSSIKYTMQEEIRKLIKLTEAKEETLVADPLPYGSGDLAPVLSKGRITRRR